MHMYLNVLYKKIKPFSAIIYFLSRLRIFNMPNSCFVLHLNSFN